MDHDLHADNRLIYIKMPNKLTIEGMARG